MPSVHVLMPTAGSGYAETAVTYLAPYRRAFAARGIELIPRTWTDGPGDGPGDGTTATLALFAWGYHLAVAQWDALLTAWPSDAPLLNPPGLLRWNTRKTYLQRLAPAGIPVVPSQFGPADPTTVAAAFAAFGTDRIVAKPQVSGGAWQTRLLRPGDPVVPIAEAILQPFLPAVGDEGELSFLFIGGGFSHAVRKVAAAGDFRIQPQFGGALTLFAPDPADVALAERVVAALPEPPLYVRVDLIRLPDGGLAVMEVEAIEPDLYHEQEPAVPGRLAEALLARLAQ